MGKKDNKPKVSTIVTKSGEQVKVFEDLESFETFIKDSADDNQFENVHCQVSYYPPFVLHSSHEDPDKIKDTENSHNKKFVRHVHQHVEKHLLKDIKGALQQTEMKFKNKNKDETFEKIVWHYDEDAELNNKRFKINVEVTCHHDDAMLAVDYKTEPIV